MLITDMLNVCLRKTMSSYLKPDIADLDAIYNSNVAVSTDGLTVQIYVKRLGLNTRSRARVQPA